MGNGSKGYRKRSYTREQLMQLLFQMELQEDFSEKGKEAYVESYKVSKSERKYFDSTFDTVISNKDDIDDKIRKHSKNWAFGRISKVDLSIMRLAVSEIIYCDDIPDSVSINEAVEMAKKFGGGDSGKFINGILGEITRSK